MEEVFVKERAESSFRRMNERIPRRVEAATRLAAVWVKDLVDDWSVVKKEIMRELDNEANSAFSRRDELTKELGPPNEMESEIIALWKELTGVQLRVTTLAERRRLTWWKPEGDE